MSSLNKKYLHYLSTHPLLTKSVTAAFFASLNEVIASIIAKEFKIPLLAAFAFFVQAPFAHYAYNFLNSIKFFKKKPLPLFHKLAQIALSLTTITPLVCVLNVTFLGLINNQELAAVVSEFLEPQQLKRVLQEIQEFVANGRAKNLEQSEALKNKLLNSIKYLAGITKSSLKRNLLGFLQSSWVSSPLILFFAQNYLDPNSWVVFFNFAYFILGTVQNTLLKLKLQKLKQQEKLKKEAESHGSGDDEKEKQEAHPTGSQTEGVKEE